MKDQSVVVAMTGGGSGGHITPLLSLAHELKRLRPDCKLIYIGHKGDKVDTLKVELGDFDFVTFINAGKFRRYYGESLLSRLFDFKTIFLNIRDVFRIIRSVGSAWQILSRTKPDVLFVKGGFVSVPVGLAARLRGIPIITHDSDTVGGLANKVVGRWAIIHATGMPTKYYKYPRASARYTGIPINPNTRPADKSTRARYKKEIGVPAAARLLLIAGGGNGSRHINQLMSQAAGELLNQHNSLYIIHVTGSTKLDSVNAAYGDNLNKAQLERIRTIDFSPEFYKYSAAADLIISRAGATAIAEFAVQRKACIIIPSPFLASGHQLKNASFLEKNDAAVIVTEEMDAQELIAVIGELLNDSTRLRQLELNIGRLAKVDASQKLAKIILEQVS